MIQPLIDAHELSAHLDDPDWLVCDCRYELKDADAGRRAYESAHISGAVYVDLHEHLSIDHGGGRGRHPLPPPARLRTLFSELGIDARVQVVAYDDAGGSIAARLWWMLRYMDHDAVAVLDGGWSAWVQAGLPVEEVVRQPQPRRFTGRPHPEWLVTVEEVTQQALLVDSRDPARYRGEVEPIDPVAGHIPGARHRFWQRNLDDQGRFLPAEQVRRELHALYGGTPAEAVTFYCGSGVTACHNVLAAVHAGLPMPRLYAGSWSEWCSDPSRPVAKGDAGVL